jgi:hypothetical protein
VRSKRDSVANMIHRSGKRLSRAALYSKQATDWCAQGIHSFKISETQVIQHNGGEVSPTKCEKESLRRRHQAEAGDVF